MSRLRSNIMLLVIWLAICFNIERLDIGGINTINLTPEIYLIIVSVVLLPMVSPFRQRPLWLSMIAAMVMLTTVLLLNPTPEFGDLHTYLTMAEISMVALTVALAYRVSGSLEEFRDAVEMITLNEKGSRLHTLSTAQDLVQTEMSGSRRSQRPLSLVLLQADASSLNMMMHRFVAELQRAMMERYVLTMAARVILPSMRRTDLIIEDQKPGRLVLVAPETPQEAAEVLGGRLVQLIQQRLGITASYGIASFPQQALTFEDLLTRAEEQLHAANNNTMNNHPAEAPNRARAVGEPTMAAEMITLRESMPVEVRTAE